jgi:CRP/FNR family transcriptional regulator, cyclic AMP receptor protein
MTVASGKPLTSSNVALVKHSSAARAGSLLSRSRREVTTADGKAGTYYELAEAELATRATEGFLMKVPGLFNNAKTVRDVPAGAVIFEEGTSGTEMFGVVEGEVEVRRANGAVRRIGPDETFGEMALIDRSPRSGTVVAVTDTKLAVIDRPTFLFLIQETPMFALQVMSSIAERLRAETSA